MLWLLRFLFFGHCHKWRTIKVNPLKTDIGDKGERYVLECERCGKVIKRDLI